MSDLPAGWKLTRLSELTNEKLSYGANAPACVFNASNLRYIRITDINENGNLNDDIVGIDSNEGENYKLKNHDFLFARSGNTVGKTFLYEEAKHQPAAYAGYLIKFTPDSSKIVPQFLKQFCFSSRYKYWVKSQIRAGAQPNINAQEYGNLELPLPPLPEQRKIAQILAVWDKAIATTEKRIANSKQQKKALMQQLLTGKKRLAGFSGSWEVVSISDLIVESRIKGTNGQTAKKITVKLYGLGVAQKEEKRLGSSSTKYYKRKSGQFIYSKLDFLNGAFGIIPSHLDDYESTLDLPAFDFTNKIVPKWFIEFVSRDSFYTANLSLANGGRKARRVNPKDLLNIKIKLPPLPEQQKIAQVLTTADKEISTLETQLAHLQQEKKALMQQLLTGKKRVVVEEG